MENKNFVKDNNLEIRIKFDGNVTTASLVRSSDQTVVKVANAMCSNMVTEKLEKGVRIQIYVGDDLVIVDAPCGCLYRLANVPLPAGLKTQLKPTANSDGYSSPLGEMLEKEKEEERTIEKMTYFEGNTTYKKEKIPHIKRLFLMRKVVDGEPVWGWFMENGKFYPRKEI